MVDQPTPAALSSQCFTYPVSRAELPIDGFTCNPVAASFVAIVLRSRDVVVLVDEAERLLTSYRHRAAVTFVTGTIWQPEAITYKQYLSVLNRLTS